MTLFTISTKFFVGVGTAFGAFPDVERNLVERVVVPFVNRVLTEGAAARPGCARCLSQAGPRAMSALTRFAARDIRVRGGCRCPAAWQAAIVLNKREAIVPQQWHVSRCRSTARRRAGVRSPST